ncbi:ion transporter [Leptospira sp. GIMC2001]|uniref:ion transporter n=1 Tax=Leptospira sp. GIMC2001 TaxID=1513297 RepID=UPI00234B071C|nr:ion transporter [Leptospira sp. GIMC2001]WCL50703.1 ion transporter [Leptospira sp. GIMC2001]
MLNYVKIMILDYTSKQGKYFSFFIYGIILFSILIFTIETLPNLDEKTINTLEFLEVIITILFTIEYALRLIFSRSSVRYIFSIYGLIDLIAILPFYLSLGINLSSLRILRLFRLFRILKLIRYNEAIINLKRSIISIKEELVIISMVSAVVIYLSSVGIYYFENEAQPEVFASVFHSLWWSMATLTTVGYGDIYPITAGGKIFTSFVIIIGIGIVAVPAGLFASALIKSRKDKN